MAARLPIHEKRSAESRVYGFNFGAKLGASETLSSSTVSSTPSGLTITGAAVNSSTFTDPADGSTIAANEGVTCRIAGGTDGVDYVLVAQAATSASNTLEVKGVLRVRD